MSDTHRTTAGYVLLALATLCIFAAVPLSTEGTDRLRAVLAGGAVAPQFNPLHAAGLLCAVAACALFLSRRAE